MARTVRPENDRASDLLADFREARLIYRPYHERWLETLLAVVGKDAAVMYQGRSMRVDERITFARAARQGMDPTPIVGHNYLLSVFRTMLGSAMQTLPEPKVAPAQQGHYARRAVEARQVLLRYLVIRGESGFSDSEREALSWAFLTGTGWFGAIWDMFAGDPKWSPKFTRDNEEVLVERVAVKLLDGDYAWRGKDGVFTQDPDGGVVRIADNIADLTLETNGHGTPITERILVPDGSWEMRGDLVWWAPSPFHVYADAAPRWRECPGFFVEQFMDVEDLKASHGSKAERCQATFGDEDFLSIEQNVDPRQRTRRRYVHVVHRFERPGRRPHGRYAICAGGVMLHDGALPTRRLPLHPIYDTPIPGSITGVSSIEQAKPLQQAIDATETDRRAHIRYHAHPRIIAVKGSLGKGVHTLPSRPGAIVEVEPEYANMLPQVMAVPQMSADVVNETDRLARGIEAITGVHGVTQGKSTGITSGRQAAVHQAADAVKWGPTIESLAAAVVDQSEVALHYWREFADPVQTITVFGPGNAVLGSLHFLREYIGRDPRVTIQASSLRPYNVELRRQQITEDWATGQIADLAELRQLKRRAGVFDDGGDDDESRARQLDEIDMMLMGVYVQPEDHEDHGAHVDTLLSFMRSREFYMLDKQVQALFRLHFRQHQFFLQPQMNPVLTGASPMPQIGDAAGAPMLSPNIQSMGQLMQPGLNTGQELNDYGAA